MPERDQRFGGAPALAGALARGDPRRRNVIEATGRGWPLTACFSVTEMVDLRPPTPDSHGAWIPVTAMWRLFENPPLYVTRGGIPLESGSGYRATLPFLPHWPGLIANTLFYAVLCCALHQLAGLAQRRRRRSRVRCPGCNYSREGLAPDTPCPECGRALARKTQSARPRPSATQRPLESACR